MIEELFMLKLIPFGQFFENYCSLVSGRRGRYSFDRFSYGQ